MEAIMNRKLLFVLVAVVMVLALPKIFCSQKAGHTGPGGKGAAADMRAGRPPAPSRGAGGAPVQVNAVVLKGEALTEQIVAPGSVQADETVELRSEAGGRLVSLQVPEGSRVARGALLAKINDADLQAQLLKTDATLLQSRQKAARQKGLFDKEAISREDYEAAVRDLESARADSALIKAQIDKTEVRAPFDGRLGLKYISVGAYLTPGTMITTLVSDRPLKIDFSVPEKYVSLVKTGDKITCTIAGSAKSYKGTVYAVDPMIDAATRSVRIRAVCTNPDNQIIPGAFAEIRLSLSEKTGVLMVPSPAVVPEAVGQKVFCIKNGVAVATAVTIGMRDSDRVEITGGCNPGDTVITTGVLLVRPGAAVAARIVR
jgi:membrane fusion protein, multidrug efflux system